MEEKHSKTNMKIEFLLISDNYFSFDDVTKKLGIKPTSSTQQEIRYEDTPRTEYVWEFATEKIETLLLEDLFKQITDIFLEKESMLISLKEKYDMYYKFGIIVEIENKQTPCLFVDKNTLKFMSNIGAELDIDLYVMS